MLLRLRSDHNFFMGELAVSIQAKREVVGSQLSALEVNGLRKRLATIARRLEVHNRLEETQTYVWPSLLFDHQTVGRLFDRLQSELENIPPRIAKIGVEFDR